MDDILAATDAATSYVRVRDEIRLDIITGTLQPGCRLKVHELSQRFGVSAPPIREALQQLQGEGLVLMTPNRGATVRVVDEQFLTDIYDVRELIERFLARRFLEVAPIEAVDELEALQTALEEAQGADPITRRAIDRRFHHQIYDTNHNQEATSILDRQAHLISALMLRFGQGAARRAQAMAEHRALIAAFRRGDAEEAGNIAAQHVHHARIDVIAQMRRAAPRLFR